jgi:hypothetical protein
MGRYFEHFGDVPFLLSQELTQKFVNDVIGRRAYNAEDPELLYGQVPER